MVFTAACSLAFPVRTLLQSPRKRELTLVGSTVSDSASNLTALLKPKSKTEIGVRLRRSQYSASDLGLRERCLVAGYRVSRYRGQRGLKRRSFKRRDRASRRSRAILLRERARRVLLYGGCAQTRGCQPTLPLARIDHEKRLRRNWRNECGKSNRVSMGS